MSTTNSAIKVSVLLFLLRTFSNVAYAIISFSLIFYVTRKLGLSTAYSTALVGSFVALNSLLYFVSGYISGKLISNRHLFLLSSCFQVFACFMMMRESIHALLLGLALFIAGNGLSATCMNNIITKTFQNSDSDRESAFFWSYSGMNLGFFVGLTLGGILLLQQDYGALFMYSGVSSVITVLLFVLSWRFFHEPDSLKFSKLKSNCLAYSVTLVSFLVLIGLLQSPHYSNDIMFSAGILIYLSSFVFVLKACKKYFFNVLSFYFLAIITLIFWVIFQIGPMGLMLFISKSVNLSWMHHQIAPLWIPNVNTVCIVLGGPLFSWAIKFLRAKGYEISDYLLFTCAMVCVGVSFLILPIGIAVAGTGLVSLGWVIGSFVLQSVGELCLAPIGYSLVGKLIPPKYQNTLMGIWMMIFGISAVGSAYFSKLMTRDAHASGSVVDHSFSHWFSVLGWVAVGSALLVYMVSFVLKRKQVSVAEEVA